MTKPSFDHFYLTLVSCALSQLKFFLFRLDTSFLCVVVKLVCGRNNSYMCMSTFCSYRTVELVDASLFFEADKPAPHYGLNENIHRTKLAGNKTQSI